MSAAEPFDSTVPANDREAAHNEVAVAARHLRRAIALLEKPDPELMRRIFTVHQSATEVLNIMRG